MRQALAGFASAAVLATSLVAGQSSSKPPGVMLADLSWYDASTTLTDSTVVVIPLGIATVEHGPHLKLNVNERLANYVATRVKAAASVVIAPTLTYHFSPTFLEYPGSTSLSRVTARDLTMDIVRSLARYGPRRFYVINTGMTSAAPLKDAADGLKDDGLLLGYTNAGLHLRGAGLAAPAEQQSIGLGVGQADEIETSIMLFVDPSAVDMSKAVREYGTGEGPMTRQKDAPGLYSATGVLGDARLATREKGKAIVDSLVDRVLEDIEKIRKADLPEPHASAPAPPPTSVRSAPPPQRPQREEQRINGCTAQEFRAIQQIGARFSSLWRQMDAERLSYLFTDNGDIRHPDGSIERGQVTIRQNRAQLFTKAEYRGSAHPLTLNDIRCVNPNVAIADGKWELRLADTTGGSAPTGPLRGLSPDKYNDGLCTLIMVGSGSNWQIEAWRYTVNPPNGAAPVTLTKPGFIGRGGGH